jgi:hypothetical protein
MTQRYVVSEPVLEGYCYFDVVDTYRENFKVASLFKELSFAQSEAQAIARRMNRLEYWTELRSRQ